MKTRDSKAVRSVVVAGFVLAYLLIFPSDLNVLLTPVERILSVTNAVSHWAYILGVAIVISWTITRTVKARKR